jgi:mono/diheme cytochrome c family protein
MTAAGSGAGGSDTGGSAAGGNAGTGGTTMPETDAGSGATGGATGTGGAGGATVPPPGASAKEVYATVCSVCHGPDGGGTKLAPEIKHPPRELLTWAVRMGREGKGFPAPMLAYSAAKISDEAVAGIIEFLWSQPRPTVGPELYLDFCGNCHGPDGKGGSVDETAAGKKASEVDDIVRGGHGGGNLANRPKYMPAFSQADLPDADLALIKAFLMAR